MTSSALVVSWHTAWHTAWLAAWLAAAAQASLLSAPARAQVPGPPDPPQPPSVCGLSVPLPASQPTAGAAPVVLAFLLCFEKQGGSSMIDPQTYLYHIRLRPSEPSRDRWVAYTDEIVQLVREDFQRLWATGFLDDLSIEAHDHVFENGVVGKIVVFNMEERQRIRIVDYEGLTKVDQSAIEEKLKEKGVAVRLDSFLDPGTLKRVATVVRDLYAEKGYQYAEVTPEVKAEGTKVVHITFTVVEGPKVAIRDVEFLGNREVTDDALAKVLKENKAQGLLTLMTGKGTFQEAKFAEDAQAIVDYYHDRGYISAQVGQPVLKVLDDSGDGRTRWVQMRIPITEGKRHTVGEVSFEGNTIVKAEALRPLFKIRSGDRYSQKDIRKGLETTREVYGSGGYYEFTAYPDLQPRDAQGTAAGAGGAAAGRDPIVDVTIRVDEGKQYFINRITFAGNTHTRDPVIRRELALVEAGVFNTQALKNSIQRLNQLGYFKPLAAEGVSVEKAQGADNKVDIELKVEEQNRNQLSFGAGASQNEGFFGNASFTTSNFLGRGESVTVSLQKGSRANNYQISFSEPFVLGRPITMGVSLFSRKIDYRISSSDVDYSEVRTGVNLTTGVPLRRFTRGFVTYGYEVVNTAASNALLTALESDPSISAAFLAEGRHVESSVTPQLVHNTVDNPYAPRRGLRLTGRYQYAGGFLGGTSDFIKPDVEAIVYRPVTRRTALGVRAQAGWIRNYGSEELPYYLRHFLGGETQIRGTDIRSVGPMNSSGVALGGTKFVLFNAEYYFDVAPQVRALLFHDAGQAFAEDQAINFRQLRTSTGAELRVTLPVIGVPFRLIYAWNIYRDTSQPARTFKFAVGTTF